MRLIASLLAAATALIAMQPNRAAAQAAAEPPVSQCLAVARALPRAIYASALYSSLSVSSSASP